MRFPVSKNAGGVGNALVAAELALAGVESHIPADEVIVAMKKIGDTMSSTLKETAEGGLGCDTDREKALRKGIWLMQKANLNTFHI